MDEYTLQTHQEFSKLQDEYHRKKKTSTGIEAVLWFLIENRKKKIWWWSYEFIGKTTSKGHWLSHRAPARASDLAINFPELVEDRKIGNLKVYRLRMENKDKIKEFLNI